MPLAIQYLSLVLKLLIGFPEPCSWNETIVVIDNLTRLKVIQITGGGFIGLGFRSFENIFKITRKGIRSCTITSTTKFEADDAIFEANAFRISADTTCECRFMYIAEEFIHNSSSGSDELDAVVARVFRGIYQGFEDGKMELKERVTQLEKDLAREKERSSLKVKSLKDTF
ncbi:hypothetical protein GIB67_001994 [Kingdonia uniflora]|uniref:Uncharacterized protein n=1 Tax=Kingdonia uniflora TaxID=39325 RepID=A0A7J7M9Y5_9MAGN|nr:hypothetical protein GIB67_001994 [Kingdonia uniflora]